MLSPMQRGMQVIGRAAVPSGALSAFVDQAASSNWYHTAAWLASLHAGFGYRDVSLVATVGGDVVGFLPMMERRDLRGRLELVALPFSHRVPVLALDVHACHALTESASRLTNTLVVRDEVPMADTGTPVDSGAVAALLELRDGYHAASSQFSGMARRGVRKAEREHVRAALATRPTEVDQFYELLLETRRRQGVPIYPRRFFHELWNTVGSGDSQLWLARHRNNVIAGLWLLLSRGHALYAFGASRSAQEVLRLRPNNLLFDRVIATLCEAGYEQLDLGSAHRGNTGLIAFKQGWGAKLAPIRWRAWTRRESFAPPTRAGLSYRAASSIFRSAPLPLYRLLSSLIIAHVG